MDYLENEFNKRFKDQELPNDQFETEDLWAEIANDLDKEKAATKSNILSKRNLLLLFFASLGLIASMFYYNQSAEVQDLKNEIEKLDSNNANDVSIKNPSSSLSANEVEVFEENTLDKRMRSSKANDNNNSNIENKNNERSGKVEIESDIQTGSKGSSKQNAIPSNNKVTKKSEAIFNKEIISSISPQSGNSVTSKLIVDNSIPKKEDNLSIGMIEDGGKERSETNSINTSESKLIFDVQALENIPFMESLEIYLGPTSPSVFIMPILSDTLLEEIKGEPRDSLSFFIAAFTGVNAVDYKFSSDDHEEIAALKNEAEKLYAGSSYGVHFGTKFKKWTITSGLEYHQLWSEFDYQGTREVPREVENVRTKIWRDVITGDDLYFLLDDVIVNDLETRTVRHYNSIQRFSIPVQFGLQKELSKLNLALDLGPVFNFTTMQSGKLLIADQDVVEFDGTDINSPFNSFDVSLMLAPSLGFDIAEKWQLILSPQWRWNSTQDKTGSDFSISKNQWNLNLGLRYTLSHN